MCVSVGQCFAERVNDRGEPELFIVGKIGVATSFVRAQLATREADYGEGRRQHKWQWQ